MKNEDNLKKKTSPKMENLKNEDYLKNENIRKTEDNLKTMKSVHGPC